MRPYKVQKIDLNNEYPCPCRRKGKLKPIVLTEALGCDRCQQIFVVKKDGQIIEQLSYVYQKKSWRWTGNKWKNAYARWSQSYLSAITVLMLGLTATAIVMLPLLLRWLSTRSIISWTVVFSLFVVLLILSLFVIYRH